MTSEKRTTDSQLKKIVCSGTSKIHGTGLFAARKIDKGEYIGTYWGPLAKRNGTYVLWVYETEDEDSAVGRSGRNLLRYLNHSTRCNAEFDGFDLYALNKIPKDGEITFDYRESEFD